MKNQWQLQEAQNSFNTVFEKALHSGPKIITHTDGETVILLSIYEYKKLTAPHTDLVDFFQNSPLYGVELDLEPIPVNEMRIP